jgi:hypothetical protein
MSTFFNRTMHLALDGDYQDYARNYPVARPKPVSLPPKLPALQSTYTPPMPIYAAAPLPPPPRPLQPQVTGNVNTGGNYVMVPRGNSTRDAILGTVNQGIGLVGNIFQARAQNSAAQVQNAYAPVAATGGGGGVIPGGQASGALGNAGAGAGSFLDSTAQGLGISTSTLMLVGGGMLLLMFMKPPGRK